mmetsp:Transcript_3555/g.7836  ORF Transcript_3555/g.7836 Transcript_3555/m.7836 type:complete len:983 (-) Transcript_3555:338-3286(-)
MADQELEIYKRIMTPNTNDDEEEKARDPPPSEDPSPSLLPPPPAMEEASQELPLQEQQQQPQPQQDQDPQQDPPLEPPQPQSPQLQVHIRRSSIDAPPDIRPDGITFHRRASHDTSATNAGRNSIGGATAAGSVMTVETRMVPLPPDEPPEDVTAAVGLEAGLDDNGALLGEGEGGEGGGSDEDRRKRLVRRSSIRRQRDIHDFRTSITTTQTDMAHLISSTDEDPTFWGVSNRWFTNAGEFVGELAGMATRRLTSNDMSNSEFPKTEGVQIVSAADDPDDENDVFDNLDDLDAPDHHLRRIETNTHASYETPFDELSSLGDTSTGLLTSNTATRNAALLRQISWILASFTLAWIVLQVALESSSSQYDIWTSSSRSNGGFSFGGAGDIFGGGLMQAHRSRRYGKLKAKLVKISGEEVFEDEHSPQHKALVYLADVDSLTLDPYDEIAATQFYQRYALAVFYFATGGPSWKSRTYWLTGRHECGWLFVICSDINDVLAEIDTTNITISNSSGSLDDISSEDGNYTAEEDDDYSLLHYGDADLGLGEGRIVTGLSLYDNGLYGKVPKEIFTLEFLQILDLGNNNLQGMIGTEFGKLLHLRKLYLEKNMMYGGLEAATWLPSLKRLNVEDNELIGTIPYDLGKLKHLEDVRLGKNQLHGTIPSSLLRSKTLTKLDLNGNQLTGEIAIYESAILEYLYLYDNELSGSLSSDDLCFISNSLVDLRLSNNSFLGKIPNVDCIMDKLELMSLAQNNLTGHINASLGASLPRIRELHLYENKLLSTIPESILRLENLTALLLGNNELTGSLTADMFKDAHNLAHFYVNSNKLSGELDDFAKADLPSLEKLRLEYNDFSGSIPKIKWKSIELLYLYNNSLTGTLDNLKGAINLRKLKVSNNTLEGGVPKLLGRFKQLEILSLNGNNLEGTLPTELKKLTALKELHVENNDFSGVVPQEVCNLRQSILEKLVSDCGGDEPEISCSCCTECV